MGDLSEIGGYRFARPQGGGRDPAWHLAALLSPFAFLDIACGDAGQMKAALSGTKANHYHGINLSEPALDLASKNLKGASFEVELDHRDFVTALTKRPEPADAAWCGLSIHHLSTEGKRDLLKAIRGSISDFLMIYEPTLNDGETRRLYAALRPREPSRLGRRVGRTRRVAVCSALLYAEGRFSRLPRRGTRGAAIRLSARSRELRLGFMNAALAILLLFSLRSLPLRAPRL
jgi:hypothetical protein